MVILLSGNLRRYTAHEDEIEVEASSVSSAIRCSVARCPDLQNVLHDAQGKLRTVHRIHLSGVIQRLTSNDGESLHATVVEVFAA
jgi:hypothetical protein